MRLFVKNILLFGLQLSVVLVLVGWVLVRFNPQTYQRLYRYQLEKLERAPACSTVFIGDSSLGNAIDAEEYTRLSGRPALNLALTGLYGYAGSYNMLKAAHRQHSELRTVVLMQTVDMLTRGTSMKGYVRSASAWSDFSELEGRDKFSFTKNYVKYVRSIPLNVWDRPKDVFQNDYIRQGSKHQPEAEQPAFSAEKINAGKLKYLLKIQAYCEKHDLKLLYLHGPLYERKIEASTGYLQAVEVLFKANDIPFINESPGIREEQLGDNLDHVHPEHKTTFTHLYYDVLSSWQER